MQINSLQSVSAAQSVGRVNHSQAAGNAGQVASSPSAATDELELSAEAQQISQAQAAGDVETFSGEIRTEKVASLRAAIASGSYESTEKLSAALDRLLDTFA